MDPLQIDTVNRNNLTVNDFSKYGRYLLDIRSWSVNINIYFLTLLQNHKVVHSYLPKACRFKLCRNKSIYIHDLFNRHQKNCYLRTFYWVNRFCRFFFYSLIFNLVQFLKSVFLCYNYKKTNFILFFPFVIFVVGSGEA